MERVGSPLRVLHQKECVVESVALTADQWKLIQPHGEGIRRIFGVEIRSYPAPIGAERGSNPVNITLTGVSEDALAKARVSIKLVFTCVQFRVFNN